MAWVPVVSFDRTRLRPRLRSYLEFRRKNFVLSRKGSRTFWKSTDSWQIFVEPPPMHLSGARESREVGLDCTPGTVSERLGLALGAAGRSVAHPDAAAFTLTESAPDSCAPAWAHKSHGESPIPPMRWPIPRPDRKNACASANFWQYPRPFPRILLLRKEPSRKRS